MQQTNFRTRLGRQRNRWLWATCACTALWVVSILWHSVYTYYGSWSTALTMGALVVEKFHPPLLPPARLGNEPVDHCRLGARWSPDLHFWLPGWRTSGPPSSMTSVTIPMWIPAAIAAFGLTRAQRHLRLSSRNVCRSCGYERAGLGDGAPCPECGKRPSTEA